MSTKNAHRQAVMNPSRSSELEDAGMIGTAQSAGPDAWPVNWNGVILGGLAGTTSVLLFGLMGLALGAQTLGPNQAFADWKTLGWGGLAFSVAGAFFSFAIAGWVAGQIGGFRRAENCMLHGACAWLLATPLLFWLGSHGAGSFMGGWYGAISTTHPAWATDSAVKISAAPGSGVIDAAPAITPEIAAKRVRNAALGIAAALLLGLVGATLGGWLSSGEPMTLTYWRIRDELASAPAT
jgi:hypothetical protein